MAVSAGMSHVHMNRRTFLTGLGAAAVVGSATTIGLPARAQAMGAGPFPKMSAPKPIPFLVGPTGAPAPFDFIHWTLPGPEGAVTPINQLPAFGGVADPIDSDPSVMTDFDGFTAYSVVVGEAESSEGPLDVELDIRVFDGKYIGEDGKQHRGTFGFF